MPNTDTNGKKQSGRHRSVARLAGVQALYEMAITNAAVDDVLKEFSSQRWKGADEELPEPLAKPDVRFMGELVRGVITRLEDLDQIISTTLEEKSSVERFEVLLRTILRAGAFELLERTEIPPRVVINEYIEVTHAFFAESEASLVNGILDKLAKKLRTPETVKTDPDPDLDPSDISGADASG
jgi:transcription antitermination protein NusB